VLSGIESKIAPAAVLVLVLVSFSTLLLASAVDQDRRCAKADARTPCSHH